MKIETHWFEPPGKLLVADGRTEEVLVKGFARCECGCIAYVGFMLPLPAESATLAVSPCGDEDHEAIMLRYTAAHQASFQDRPELAEMDALEAAKILLSEAFEGVAADA